MAYKIETISVYEAFEKKCTCPLCSLQNKLEADYVDYYLGNAANPYLILIKEKNTDTSY